MSATNKYGELEGGKCPECGDPIKPQWVACPECGASLVKGRRIAEVSTPVETPKSLFSQTCPGCGEKATAAGQTGPFDSYSLNKGYLCKNCQAFVHFGCLVDNALCPVCGLVVGNLLAPY